MGLNPSIANAEVLDPTTRKLIQFAIKWEYDQIILLNLFSIINRKSSLLCKYKDPIGEGNEKKIHTNLLNWEQNKNITLWLGWGNKGKILLREKQILEKISQIDRIPFLSGLTKNLSPEHPLYIPNESKLFPIDVNFLIKANKY